ncbi:hypothetical protein GCM10022245_26050 [Streptomyces mayteni]
MKLDSTEEPEDRRPWERSRARGEPPTGGPGGPAHGPNRYAEYGGGRWHTTLSVPSIIVVVLIVIWTVFAVQWGEQDCALPTSYALVITHGTPSVFEGCGDDYPVDVTDD